MKMGKGIPSKQDESQGLLTLRHSNWNISSPSSPFCSKCFLPSPCDMGDGSSLFFFTQERKEKEQVLKMADGKRNEIHITKSLQEYKRLSQTCSWSLQILTIPQLSLCYNNPQCAIQIEFETSVLVMNRISDPAPEL